MKSGVYETTTTSGTGTVTLSSVTGRPRFADAFATGLLVPYALKDGNNREWGMGTVSAANTLARTVVLATLVSGTYDDTSPAAITLSGGTVDVWCAPLGEMIPCGLAGVRTVSSRKALYSAHITNGTITAQTLTADRLYIAPFKLEQAVEINGFLFDMDTNAATSKARVGLYLLDASGEPTTVLCETGDIDTTVAAGVLSGSVTAQKIPAGWYGVGFVCSGAIAVKAHTPAQVSIATPFGVEGVGSSMAPVVFRYKSIAGWSALPASPASLSDLTSGGNFPAVALKLV
jgi:hypothetical protein